MKLPVVSGRELIKVLAKIGFVTAGQKGSHIRLNKKIDGKTIVLVVPNHDELAVGTLNDIIKRAGLMREQLTELLK